MLNVKPITARIDTNALTRLQQKTGGRVVSVSGMSDKERADYYYKQLSLIASIEIDDDVAEYPNEMTGETEHAWLSDKDARDSLTSAVELARDATSSWVTL